MHRNLALRNVRFNWLDVLAPKKYNSTDKESRYRAEILMEAGSEADKQVEEAVLSAAEEKWPGKGEGMISVARSNNKVCAREGEHMPLDKKTLELPQYYEGQTVLSSSRVFERDGALKVYCKRKSTGNLVVVTSDTVFDDDLIRPVRGNHGDALVSLWGFEFNGSPQINCTLEAVIFNDEGEPLGGRTPITDDTIATAFGVGIEAPF